MPHLPRFALSALLTLLLAVAGASCGGEADPAAAPERAASPAAGEPGPEGEDATRPTRAESSTGAGGTAGTAAGTAPDGAPGGDLVDRAAELGLVHANRSGEPDKRTILEANGAGVALLDLESDGDLDVVLAQGLPSLAALRAGPGADLAVFLNDGTGRFTRGQSPGLSGWWTGLATGDVDGDGDTDLVAGGFGDVAVLLQAGDGRLVRRAESGAEPEGLDRLVIGAERAAGKPPAWTTSLALCDLDGDGALDLYLGRYLDLDPVDPPLTELGQGALAIPCRWRGHAVYCGPAGLPAQGDRVLRGRGDGRFEDVTAAWLPDHAPGYTLGVVPTDLDGDFDTDLFVANDSSANLLLVNELAQTGRCRLVDRGYEAGVAFGSDGRAEAGMGVAAGDVNRDGRVDLVVTNFSGEPTALYLASETGFENVTYRLGLASETRRLLSWGVHLVDFDGDGWLELFTANGHVYPQADREGTGTSYAQPDTLWRLGPLDRAERVAPQSPRSALALERGTRGTATGDLDGDGAPDLVAVAIDAPVVYAVNERGPSSHRLLLRLFGDPRETRPAPPPAGPTRPPARRTPRDGMGARAIVVVGEGAAQHALLAETQTAQGYQSASSPWLAFGLGAHERHGPITVLWPSGRTTELPPGPADRRLVVVENQGLVSEEPLR